MALNDWNIALGAMPAERYQRGEFIMVLDSGHRRSATMDAPIIPVRPTRSNLEAFKFVVVHNAPPVLMASFRFRFMPALTGLTICLFKLVLLINSSITTKGDE